MYSIFILYQNYTAKPSVVQIGKKHTKNTQKGAWERLHLTLQSGKCNISSQSRVHTVQNLSNCCRYLHIWYREQGSRLSSIPTLLIEPYRASSQRTPLACKCHYFELEEVQNSGIRARCERPAFASQQRALRTGTAQLQVDQRGGYTSCPTLLFSVPRHIMKY